MIKNVIDFVVFATILFLTFWEENDHVDIICCVVGVFGLCYILYHIFKFLFNPIKRDLLLISGKFLRRVLFIVLFVPYVISMFSICRDKVCNCENDPLHSTSGLLFPGDDDRADATNASDHVFWSVYYHFVDPGNQHIAVEKFGRNLAALIALLGVFLLNGLLISTLIGWFDSRKEKWTNGDICYGRFAFWCKKYAVVIGVDDNAPTIIRNLLEGKGECKNLDYVVVLTNLDVETVRSQIFSYLSEYRQKQVIIYRGQLDALEQISRLRLNKVEEIYVLGEKQVEDVAHSFHDIQNMKIVHNIASYLTDKCVDHRKVCRVLFEYQTTFSVFQSSDLPSKITEHLVFIPFNNYENWAQCVLVKGSYSEDITKVLPMQRRLDFQNTRLNNIFYSIINSLSGWMKKNNIEPRTFDYFPLEGTRGFSVDTGKYVHFVVVGMSKMGVAMALQAAQIAHYPNFKPENGRRTRITFIDPYADAEKEFFMGRFQDMFNLTRHRYLDLSQSEGAQEDWIDPIATEGCKYYDICEVKKGGEIRHDNFIDLEWEFIKGDIEQPGVKCYLKKIANEASEKEKVLTIAICRPLAHEAIAAALYMPSEVYESVQQVWVYQREASDMVANFIDDNNVIKHYNKIRPFGMLDADFTTDRDNYYRAQLTNYVYDLMFDDTVENEKINEVIDQIEDASDKCKMSKARTKWKKLTMEKRWSNKYLANSFETKLRSLGHTTSNMELNLDIISARFKKNEKEMAECEHNRWNVQQLLMGVRAYRNEELKDYFAANDKKEYKDKMKQRGIKAHLNICSFEKLKEIDKDAYGYDAVFNTAIPYILKVTEKARKVKK